MATYDRILIRRDTASNWSSENPVLSRGEMGYDETNDQLKVGDGVTAWNSLSYISGDYADPLTTNGDIVIRSGGNTTRLAIGSSNQVLTVNAGIPSWQNASGGGGGGGALIFYDEGPLAPVKTNDITNYLTYYEFEDGMSQELWGIYHVPSGYQAGAQINLKIQFFALETTNNVHFKTTSYLIREGTDAIDSTTNNHASTNSAFSLPGTGDVPNLITIDLTDGSGEINSVAVSEGDIIRFKIYRDTDTATATAKLLPYTGQIS